MKLKRIAVQSLAICFIVVLIPIGTQVLQIVRLTGKVSYNNLPFEQNHPQAKLRILFLGDSTAHGTGAIDNRKSVAGWFGQDFPQAHIINISQNGKRLIDLVNDFDPSKLEHYRLIVIQIGGNDIMKLTPLDKVEKEIAIVIDRAKMTGDHVVILHSGNVGLSPIFTWPFDWVMSERSRAVRTIYIRQAKEKGVFYVDLFAERKNDLFLKDVDRYYSPDLLHPSGQGYRWWYERIRATLVKNKVIL